MKTYTNHALPYVHMVEIERNEIKSWKIDTCKEPKESVESYYKRQIVKPNVIINGGFFGMDALGNPCWTLITNGETKANDDLHTRGFGTDDGHSINYGDVADRKWESFVTAFPMLIVDGHKTVIGSEERSLDYKARRTVVAWNENKVYILAIDNPGCRFFEIQDILLDLNVDFAAGLDGGGSTKCIVNGQTITQDVTNRAVDNVVCFYLKNVPSTKTIYRVQLGSFVLKKNADAFLEKIKALGGSYTQAFVQKVGVCYKIQLGAFSNKSNAQNMVNDLKGKGFEAFVVSCNI